jgi:HTH-type transcriptional regulator/antitoxin HigA
MIVTWIVLARYEARRIDVNSKFDRGSCLELTTELRTIFHENSDTLKRVTQVMSSHGIRFSVVDKLEHASIDGYSYIDTDGVPVIVVTLRHKKIDFFAFTVLHEVCHVYKHLNSENNNMISLSDYDNETVEEEEANAFASNVLIPQALWRIAPEVPMNPFVIQRRYTLWAEKNHLNKWIVLGRVSHETGMYKFKTDESRLIH